MLINFFSSPLVQSTDFVLGVQHAETIDVWKCIALVVLIVLNLCIIPR